MPESLEYFVNEQRWSVPRIFSFLSTPIETIEFFYLMNEARQTTAIQANERIKNARFQSVYAGKASSEREWECRAWESCNAGNSLALFLWPVK